MNKVAVAGIRDSAAKVFVRLESGGKLSVGYQRSPAIDATWSPLSTSALDSEVVDIDCATSCGAEPELVVVTKEGSIYVAGGYLSHPGAVVWTKIAKE